MDTRELYQRFACEEARNASPYLEQLANMVSQTHELRQFLEGLAAHKRQPNLFFGVVRLLSGERLSGDLFQTFVNEHPAQILTTMLSPPCSHPHARETSTNQRACTQGQPLAYSRSDRRSSRNDGSGCRGRSVSAAGLLFLSVQSRTTFNSTR